MDKIEIQNLYKIYIKFLGLILKKPFQCSSKAMTRVLSLKKPE